MTNSGKFKILTDVKDSAFTGERFLPNMSGGLELDHLHRYVAASEICANKRVLDIACGEGYGSYLLSQIAQSVTGVDIDHKTIQAAKDKYQKENLSFVAADCLKTGLPEQSFDVIVSFETIEHINEHSLYINELRRLLAPGGILIISTPNSISYNLGRETQNHFHLKELNLSEFKTLLEDNFKFVSLISQKNFYGSVCLPIDKTPLAAGFSYFTRESDEIHCNQETTPLYLLAVCSNDSNVTLSRSLYESQFRFNNVDALIGGIKERDSEICKLKEQIENVLLNEIKERDLEIEQFKNQIANFQAEVTGLNAKIAELGIYKLPLINRILIKFKSSRLGQTELVMKLYNRIKNIFKAH